MLAVLAGLPLGWFLASATHVAPDRAARAIALFRAWCLPMAQDRQAPGLPGPLVPIPLTPREMLHADPVGRLTVSRDRRACAVSDIPGRMTPEDVTRLHGLAAALVADELPMLRPEPEPGAGLNWPLFVGWVGGQPLRPERWGILLTRTPEPDAITALSLSVR